MRCGRATQGARGGFTLLEMLVALAVFAVLGVMSSQLLMRIADMTEVTSDRGARLIDVQRAFAVVKRDLLQLVDRGVRDGLGDPLPAVRLGEQDLLLELTRAGWRNPLGLRRSELQRVGYALHEDTLFRYYWNVLDRAPDSEPLVQTLIENVETVEFIAVDAAGNEHTFWPPIGAAANNPGMRLTAIVLRANVPPFGELTRIFDVISPAPRGVPAGGPGS